MPQLKELKGTAAATKPALTKNAEREIGSPIAVGSAAGISFLLTTGLDFFTDLKSLIIPRLKSSISKKGIIINFATDKRKKATKIMALADKKRLR